MAVLSSLIHGSRRSRQPVGVPTASRVRRVRESICDLLSPPLAPQGLLSLDGRPDSLIHGSRRSRQPVGVPTASRVRRVRESICDLLSPPLAPQGLLSLDGRPDSLIHGSRRSRQPVGVPTASRARRVRESSYNTHRLPDRAGHLMCPALLVYPIPDSADPYHRSGFFSAHYKFSQKFSSFFVLVAVNL